MCRGRTLHTMSHPPVVLVIAGSDSGGGAGIQADLKTVMALGGHAATVITAVTAQNSLGVQGVWPLAEDAVAAQFRSIIDDFTVGAVKIGMLGTAALVEQVRLLLAPIAEEIPVVLDPVCASKHGDPLLQPEAVSALVRDIVPLATVVTPNIPEAALLLAALGDEAALTADDDGQRRAAAALTAAGARWALVKGGHRDDDVARDVLSDGTNATWLTHDRVDTVHTHGTGCTLASAIAAGLAGGMTVPVAVAQAKDYISGAVAHGYALGAGIGPVDHAWRWRNN